MPFKVGHSHRLNELPYGPSATLLDDEPLELKHEPPLEGPNSKIRAFLKHLGLQLPDSLIGTIFAWRSPREHQKVATYQNRTMAALNSLLHLLPTSACIVLLVLFWSKKWTGGPSDCAPTLQFVAKLHELLMQSSLVAILLHIIRSQAINGFIPLGALSGATKGPQLSYLWSLDFFSAILSSNFGKGRKVSFVLSTFGLLFLTGVVGPSSAVLMIPRPGMPHERIRRTIYTHVSERETFPSSFNYTHKLNFSTFDQLIYADFLESYNDGLRTKVYSGVWGDGSNQRTMKMTFTKMSQGANHSQVIATMPTYLSMVQLSNQLQPPYMKTSGSQFDNVANTTIAITTLQPGTLVTCAPYASSEEENDIYYLLHNGTSRFLSTAANMFERMRKLNESSISGDETPLWVPSPHDPASLIGIFPTPNTKSLATCTVTTFWARTKIWRDNEPRPLIRIDLPAREHVSEQVGFEPITIATEGIAAINSASWLAKVAQYEHVTRFSSILAKLFVSAISLFPGGYNEGLTQGINACCDAKYLTWTEAAEIDQGANTPFEITATDYGYGYGATDMSIRLSVAVLTAYCIIAFLYVIYIIATGHTSAAWDSATELILLALQSKEPKDLGYVSVGLDSMETFSKGVGIRVSTVKDDDTGEEKEKLELVFDNEETEKRGLTKIVPGNVY